MRGTRERRQVTPHIGGRVVGLDGETIARIGRSRRRLRISESTRSTILEGLNRAAMEPGGTSYSVFGSFPVAIAGEDRNGGAGEGSADQSWYAAVAPHGDPRIVVAATVERGGFGVESAAPIVAQILERYFDADRGKTAYPLDRATRGGVMEAGAKPLTIAPRGPRLAERLRLSYVDGILLGTSIGPAALSVFVLATATSEEIAGSRATSPSARACTRSSVWR